MGEGDRKALLLHGFPDDAGSMVPLMEALANKGFTAVAPYMRGYGRTGQDPDGNYMISRLAADAVGLAEAMGGEKTLLIGHDWGAVAAYAAANLKPEQFSRIVTMAVPPLRVFLANLLRHPRQVRRSWYMLFFQLPFLPERKVPEDEFAFLDRLWRDWSPGWEYSRERIDSVKNSLRGEGNVRAALAYYRGLLRSAPLRFRDYLESRRLSFSLIRVPALVLAGEQDGCIGTEIFEGLERAFSGPYRYEKISGAGHFMHLEQPEATQEIIQNFLGA
jgi:pimeloyl-ACP methyl ester carboxylesterase